MKKIILGITLMTIASISQANLIMCDVSESTGDIVGAKHATIQINNQLDSTVFFDGGKISSVEILADKFKTSSAATETQNIRANNETRKLTIKTIGEASLELVKNNNVYASAKMKNCSEE